MSREKKGFAARWSERKITAHQDDDDNHQTGKSTSLQDKQEHENIEDSTKTRGDPLTEADFDDVDFEALDKSSDYTRFIKSDVPEAIQKKALRKLWTTDPVFEVLDGMNDYDEDFTGDGLAGRAFKTAYKIGQGYLTDDEAKGGENKGEEVFVAEDKDRNDRQKEINPEPEPDSLENKETDTGNKINIT